MNQCRASFVATQDLVVASGHRERFEGACAAIDHFKLQWAAGNFTNVSNGDLLGFGDIAWRIPSEIGLLKAKPKLRRVWPSL